MTSELTDAFPYASLVRRLATAPALGAPASRDQPAMRDVPDATGFSSAPGRKVLLVTRYDHDDIGGRAVLGALCESLQSTDPGVRITLVSAHPEARALPGVVRVIPRGAANLPGRYYFDFDQSLDEETASTEYIVRKTNEGANARTEYEDLSFGPLAGAAELELCSVQGTVASAQGEPVRNVLVRATLVPTFKDGLGRVAVSEKVLATYTDGNGDFDLPLVRGGIFRLEIVAVGYDRKVTIPDQASVLFTDL